MAGETTGSPGSNPPFAPAEGMFTVPLSQAFLTTDNQLADVKQMGYIPNGKVLGFMYLPTDMDGNVSPALVHKITVGSTDLATGLTGGQTGVGSFVPCVPTEFTAGKTLVTVTSTTAAATGAAGTLYLGVVMQK